MAAANYLTVAQIYLQANPLVRTPLAVADIKPRLLGHWGTSPGLSLIYVQLNRLIRETGAEVIFVAGPGHGGPALIAECVDVAGRHTTIVTPPRKTPADSYGYPRTGRAGGGL